MTMTEEKIGSLFEALANHYWSVPIKFVIDRMTEWHPEVTKDKIERVLKRCDDNLFWHHCCVETDGLEEPELVVEHLVVLGREDLDRFISARIAVPICVWDEESILNSEAARFDLPEAKAIIQFGKTELALNDSWVKQLVEDCSFNQPLSFCEGKSWVMGILHQEQYGKIHFRTIEQVKRFRELGNNLYRVIPNPVFRGWKPVEINNPPVLLDDIPKKDEDIPDGRKKLDKIFAPYGGRQKAGQLLMQGLLENAPRKKIGRNEPCPCGSGMKYKKCCGK